MGNVTLEIAKQITKYRTVMGLSKKALAECVGVKPSTVSGWENGEYAPGVDTLVKLCNLFHITLDEIYGITDEKTPPAGEPDGGEYKDIIELLDKLPREQIAEVKGYLKHLVYECEAVETAKQITEREA